MKQKMMNSSKLVIPQNSQVLNTEEMRSIDGGAAPWEIWLKAQIDKWLKR